MHNGAGTMKGVKLSGWRERRRVTHAFLTCLLAWGTMFYVCMCCVRDREYFLGCGKSLCVRKKCNGV
jgi:hypothetical protein